MKTKLMKIAFTGVPSSSLIQEIYTKYPDAEWVDLDVPYRQVLEHELLTQTTCNIIKTILNNLFIIKPDIVLFAVGYAKCDYANFLYYAIKEYFPNTVFIVDDNKDTKAWGTPISMSELPLLDKFTLITNGVIDRALGKVSRDFKQSVPAAGFWGVPPFDFAILELFPNNTHIYGWTRLMENGTPANIDLEQYVDDVPTVFFTQAFCAKSVLAKSLAKKYNGLFVEVDGKLDNSSKAKIQAFLELNL